MAEETDFTVIVKAVDEASKVLLGVKKQMEDIANQAKKPPPPKTMFDKLSDSAKQAERNIAALPLGVGAFAAGFTGAIVAGLSFAKAVDAIKSTISDSLTKYSEYQSVQLQLKAIWEGTGRALPIEAVKQYASALSQVTLYSQSSLEASAKTLAIFPGITDELLPKVMEAATKIAALKGISVESAAQMLGRASTGSMARLAMMTGAISKTTVQTKDFALAIDEINTKLAGVSGATINTYAGQLKRLENTSSSLKKALGAWLEPIARIGAKDAADEARDFAAAIKELLESPAGGVLKKNLEEWAAGWATLDDKIKATINSYIRWIAEQGRTRPKTPKGEPVAGEKEGPGLPWYVKAAAVVLPQINFVPGAKALMQFMMSMKETGEATQKTTREITTLEAEFHAFNKAEEEAAKKSGKGLAPKTKEYWEAEIKRAEDYYARKDQLDKDALAAEKASILESTASNEAATNKIAELEIKASNESIAAAKEKRNAMLSLNASLYAVEKATAEKMTDPEAKEAALTKIIEKENLARMAIEKSYTDALVQELNTRRSKEQEWLKQRQEITDKIKQELLDQEKALQNLGTAGMGEMDKLVVKFQQANDLLEQAIKKLPDSPAKAIELAKQARDAFAGLQQDTFNLLKNLEDTGKFYRNLEQQIASTGLTGAAKRRAEVDHLRQILDDARDLRDRGLLKESEAAYKEAAQKAAGLATPIEGMSKESARAEAMEWIRVIRAENVEVVKQQNLDAIKMNDDLAQKMMKAGDVIIKGLNEQYATVNEALSNNTEAIINLTTAITAKAVQGIVPGAPAAAQDTAKNIGAEVASAVAPMAQAAKDIKEAIRTSPLSGAGGTFNAVPFQRTSTLTAEETAAIDESTKNFEEGLSSVASKVTQAYGTIFDKVDIMAGFGDGLKEAVDKIGPPRETEYSPETKQFQAAQQKAAADQLYAERMEALVEKWTSAAEAFMEAMGQGFNVTVDASGGLAGAAVDVG